MVMSQAVSIAEAYLEEISLKPFADPDGSRRRSNSRSTSTTSTTTTGSSTSALAINSAMPIGGACAAIRSPSPSRPSAALAGVPAADAARIDVRVLIRRLRRVALTGYKTRL